MKLHGIECRPAPTKYPDAPEAELVAVIDQDGTPHFECLQWSDDHLGDALTYRLQSPGVHSIIRGLRPTLRAFLENGELRFSVM